MPIIFSIIVGDTRQADGRRRVEERHVDQAGAEHHVSYLCEAGFNAQTALSSRISQLNESLKETELSGMITDYPWDYVQTESTVAELVAYVRAAYRDGKKDELVPIASRILEWITNGRFNDTQVRNAFGLTAAQWTTLKNKMTALVNARVVIETAAGE